MKTFLSLVAFTALAAAGARADISIVLDDPNQTGTAGQTLNFFGTITNTSSDTNPADAIYFNSDSLNFTLTDATVSDNFYANVPISLVGGQSSGDIDLFDITLANPETQPLGVYSGSYELIGGADGGTLSAQDNLAQTSFSVNVTPEPSHMVLVGGAFALMGWLRRRRVRARAL